MVNVTIIWALIILFILQPGVAHEGAVAGAHLFMQALLPYLLPYIILTQWLLKMPANHVSSRWKRYIKAYVLGCFGGFPVGAVTVSEMKRNGEFSPAESSLLLAACHAPGPMFIIGFIGSELFGNLGDGWKLLAAIHIANLLFFLCALLLLFRQQPQLSGLPQDLRKPSESPLLDSIKESSSVIILVATTVIFFSALGTVISTLISVVFPVDMAISKTLLLALFEMTSGVQSATESFQFHALFPALIAAIVSINGFSIHIQVFTIAKSAGISVIPYILGRFFNTILVPIIFILLI